jgi:fructokinase
MVGLGEVLWDFLPSGKTLGGAPTNFAYISSIFGNRGVIASRVGNDVLGREARAAMSRRGLSTSFIQNDDVYETGTAGIFVDSDSQPIFTIKEPVAWDFLKWTSAWEDLSSRANAVCFGSLAQRSHASAETIERFLENTPSNALIICDANLREPFYSVEILYRSLRHADVLKLNDHELIHITSLLGINGDDDISLAKKLSSKFDIELVCITRGARGSILISESKTVEHSGISIQVADPIGAGDAFAACVAHYYIQGRPLEEISEAANRLAAWVATQVGATPLLSQAQLDVILNKKDQIERQTVRAD